MRNRIKSFVFILTLLLLYTSISSPQEKNSVDEKSIKAIINKFYDEDPFVNGEAIAEIVKSGNKTIDYLIESLEADNDNVRWCSAIALGKIAPEGERAIPFLTKALRDSNSNVRYCSAIALGKFREASETSIPDLQKLLNDDDEDVRWAAYISLSKINKESINQAPELSEILQKLEYLTPQFMKELNVPGVSIALIRNNETEFIKGFGVEDVRTSAPVTNETMFEACSMSKPVFAYLVLKLTEQKKLNLDVPLSTYLPEEFVCEDENYSNQITARMILAHTSGFPNWRKGEEEREGPIPIYFKPGQRFSYSGEGYYYLQRVVEKVTGKPLEEYARETLFKPLGLKHSSYVWTDEIDSLISCGHDALGKFLGKSKYLHSNSAYTFYSTAEDYARFIIEILKLAKANGSITNKSIKEMLSPQIDVMVRNPIDRPGSALGLFVYWGLGWAIDSTSSGKIYYHSGANRTGFRCYSQFRLDEGSGIVIMTNGLNGGELWSRLIKEIGDF